jgi:hypothetical protein
MEQQKRREQFFCEIIKQGDIQRRQRDHYRHEV